MKTREKILYVSQDLFNRSGTADASTVDIANEMEISPGNLYYHFRNKEEIINELFSRFEENLGQALSATEMSITHLIDTWLHMKLVFELLWDNRFIYRDTHHLINDNRSLKRRYKRLFQKKSNTLQFILDAFIEKGVIIIQPHEKSMLLDNLLIVASNSLNHHALLHASAEQSLEASSPTAASSGEKPNIGGAAIQFAIQQVMILITPYLKEDVKAAFHEAVTTSI